MNDNQVSWITKYIWGIANDVLRDIYVRGKYRDVILPMTVLRRFDAVLEDSKEGVLKMKETLDRNRVTEQDAALRGAAGQDFYNTSEFRMRDLRDRAGPDPLCGLFETTVNGKSVIAEYGPDTELRDTEQIPLQEEGGVKAFIRREALPYAPDAWYRRDSEKIGYEINFNRYFYKPAPMRTLEEIRADILALEQETEGLLGNIIGGKNQ